MTALGLLAVVYDLTAKLLRLFLRTLSGIHHCGFDICYSDDMTLDQENRFSGDANFEGGGYHAKLKVPGLGRTYLRQLIVFGGHGS